LSIEQINKTLTITQMLKTHYKLSLIFWIPFAAG